MDKCESCGRYGDIRLVSDGTDSGESDMLCEWCRGERAGSDTEVEDLRTIAELFGRHGE